MEKKKRELPHTCQTRRRRVLALALRVEVSLIRFQMRPPESCFFTISITRVPQNAPIPLPPLSLSPEYTKQKRVLDQFGLFCSIITLLSSRLCGPFYNYRLTSFAEYYLPFALLSGTKKEVSPLDLANYPNKDFRAPLTLAFSHGSQPWILVKE